MSADALTLYFSVSVGTEESIYVASRSGRTLSFSPATALSIANSTAQEGTPFISHDGLSLYFFSTRMGGQGDRDLWGMARSDTSFAFGTPFAVQNVSTVSRDHSPWLSQDGLVLWFGSSRTGTAGDMDLWTASRTTRAGLFASPTGLSEINTAAKEDDPGVSGDELELYFMSDRLGGQGLADIYAATRSTPSGPFSTIENLGVVNSIWNDACPAPSADGRELFFCSSRGGTSEIWRSVRDCL